MRGRPTCTGISTTARSVRHFGTNSPALGLFAILQTYEPQHPALLGPWSEVFAQLGKSPTSGEPLPGRHR